MVSLGQFLLVPWHPEASEMGYVSLHLYRMRKFKHNPRVQILCFRTFLPAFYSSFSPLEKRLALHPFLTRVPQTVQ